MLRSIWILRCMYKSAKGWLPNRCFTIDIAIHKIHFRPSCDNFCGESRRINKDDPKRWDRINVGPNPNPTVSEWHHSRGVALAGHVQKGPRWMEQLALFFSCARSKSWSLPTNGMLCMPFYAKTTYHSISIFFHSQPPPTYNTSCVEYANQTKRVFNLIDCITSYLIT